MSRWIADSHRNLFSTLTILLAFTLLLAPAASAKEQIRAGQGELARWLGDGIDSCGMDGRTWPALEDGCYFPIDVDRTPGTVEIAVWRGAQMESAWLIVEARDYGTQEIDFPDEDYVHLSEENLARHYGEQAEIKPQFRRGWNTPAKFTIPTAKPLDPLPTCKNFAVFRVFNGESKNRHTGIDCAVGMGTSTKSIAAGTVVLLGEHFFAGTSVYVDHGNGMISMYFHLSEITVAVGDEVERGGEVGKIGSTGRSTGPHLHLGVRWRGARIDPALLYEPDRIPTLGQAP